MSADLDTLLRDAGREPTTDLDIDEVHTRGRRRTRVRRVAVGAGALVLVGALALAVPQLLGADRPGLDPIDDAPATEAPGDGPVLSVGTTPRGALASELGRDLQLHRHEVDSSALTTWTVERTRTDGTSDTRSLVLPLLATDPVVDRDGGVWSSDDHGVLLRDGERLSEQAPELAGAWLPVGTDEVGSVVVTPRPGFGGDETPDGPQLHTVGSDGSVLPSNLDLVTAALPEGASVFAFDEAREHAVVLGSVAPPDPRATDQLLLVVPYGGEPRDLLAEPPVADAVGDSRVTMVHIVGDQVWLAVVAPVGGTSSLERTSRIVRVPLDPTDAPVTLLPTPDPAGLQRIDGQVVAIDATDDGAVVLLGRSAVPDFPAPYVVRPAMADALADGAITELDARGVPTLLPATGDAGPLADCATEAGGGYINARPLLEQTVLYYLCTDATAQLPDGAAYPFVISERIAGPAETTDADSLLQLLQTWAAGPTPQEADAGLSGGLDEDVATIADVTVDGTQVTVDLVPGEQVGVLSATYASGAFTGAVVGMVLQYEQFETVRITLDGSCEAWGGHVEAESCLAYDASDAPWAQPGGADG